MLCYYYYYLFYAIVSRAEVLCLLNVLDEVFMGVETFSASLVLALVFLDNKQ